MKQFKFIIESIFKGQIYIFSIVTAEEKSAKKPIEIEVDDFFLLLLT